MNKFSFTKTLVIIIFAMIPFSFFGQESDRPSKPTRADFKNYLYFTGDFGLGMPSADNFNQTFKPNGHIGMGWQFDNIVGLKGKIGYGALGTDLTDANTMKLDYIESSLSLTMSLTDIIFGYNPNRLVNFVPHIGIGQLQYRQQFEDQNDNVIRQVGYDNNNPINEKGGGILFRKVVFTIPMGAELNFRLGQHWGIYLDYTASRVDSRTLDGKIDGDKRDWFTSFNLGAVYKLNNASKRDSAKYNNWFLTLDGGAAWLYGDNTKSLDDVKGNLNIGVGYFFGNCWSVYAKFGYGILEGAQVWQDNVIFEVLYSDYYAANINLSLDLINCIFGYKENRLFGLSPHIGYGQIQYRTKTLAGDEYLMFGYDNDSENNLKGDGMYNRRVVATVPMGIELTYRFHKNLDIYADYTVNWTNTDILDGRASGNCYDYFNTANVGLRYKFNKKCEPVVEEEPVEPIIQYIQPETPEPIIIRDTVVIEKTHVYYNAYTDAFFGVGDSQIHKDYRNLPIVEKAADGSAQIREVVVNGYASPEGPAELNLQLSENRANAAADYMKQELSKEVNITEIDFVVEGKGADWEGFIQAVKESNIEGRDEIVSTLNSTTEREDALREIMAKYPQVRKLFPQLRRAGITITSVK